MIGDCRGQFGGRGNVNRILQQQQHSNCVSLVPCPTTGHAMLEPMLPHGTRWPTLMSHARQCLSRPHDAPVRPVSWRCQKGCSTASRPDTRYPCTAREGGALAGSQGFCIASITCRVTRVAVSSRAGARPACRAAPWLLVCRRLCAQALPSPAPRRQSDTPNGTAGMMHIYLLCRPPTPSCATQSSFDAAWPCTCHHNQTRPSPPSPREPVLGQHARTRSS